MKKRIKTYQLIIAILVLIVFQWESWAQTPNWQPENWELIFHDDFNKKLDPDVWRIRNNYDHGGEPQMYTNREKNVRVEDGLLLIECHKENYKNHEYTSAYVDLKKDYKYGYFEIHCKMPLGKGLWPAFWFSSATSTKDGWPPEIDIFETNGKDHTFTSGGVFAKENGKATKTFEFRDYQQSIDEWHTYAIEWAPEIINWYIDDQLIASTTIDVPNILRRLVINLALFPWHQPDHNADYFPARFEIDYIKIWKRIDGCPYLSWKESWVSEMPSQISNWKVKPNDQVIIGDFDGDSREELFLMNSFSKKAVLSQFKDGAWLEESSNSKRQEISGWKIHSKDQYIPGDFDGDGKDEILFLNYSNKQLQLFSFQKRKWRKEMNSKNSAVISGWQLDRRDRFAVGDFDGNGRDEILFINSISQQVQLYQYKSETRAFESMDPEYSDFKEWEFDPADQYIIGDYNNDGKDEILFINFNQKQVRHYRFKNGSWDIHFSNQNSGAIGTWMLNHDDIYLSGDFDNNGTDDILFINSRSNHSRIYNPTQWDYIWTNHGNLNIYNWHIFLDQKDQVMVGNFDLNSSSQLLVIRNSGIEDKRRSDHSNTIKAKMYQLMRCEKKKTSRVIRVN